MVLFNSDIGELRGSIGGKTFSRNRSGDYIRRKTSPVQPETPKQTETRERMTGLSKAWSNDLTQVQRDAWNDLASNTPVTNRFGNPITLTGLNWFTRINISLVQSGESAVADAPADLNVGSLTSVTIIVNTESSSEFVMDIVPDCAANERYVFDFAHNQSPGKNFIDKEYKRIQYSAVGNVGSSYNLELPDQDIFMREGLKQFVRVRLLNVDNGVMSPGIVASGITGA